jgi:hypothetical protein
VRWSAVRALSPAVFGKFAALALIGQTLIPLNDL